LQKKNKNQWNINKYLKLHDYCMKGSQFEKYDDKRRLEILLLIQMDSYDKSMNSIIFFDHIWLV